MKKKTQILAADFVLFSLGDDDQGHDYVTQICSLKKDPMILDGEQRIPKTVAGYLDLYTSIGLPTNVDPRTFLFNVSKFNSQLPRNVNSFFVLKVFIH